MNNLQEKILDIIQENYNDHKGTNEAELASSEDIAHLLDQEMVKFCQHIKDTYGIDLFNALEAYKAEMNTVDK